MQVLYIEWNSFCSEDVREVLEYKGYELNIFPYRDISIFEKDDFFVKAERVFEKKKIDFIFSFNYFPVISLFAQEKGIPYISWVYDNPYKNLYSYTIVNTCNHVFIFDYTMWKDLYDKGIRTVYYLPMGVNTKRLSRLLCQQKYQREYSCDISFVGSLYTEKKHALMEKFQNLSKYSNGYLEALIQAQKNVYGYYFLQELLNSEIVADMQKCYPTDPEPLGIETPEYIYADYVLARQVTAYERQEIIEKISRDFQCKLFTHDESCQIGSVQNMGPVDYYKQMPFVFKHSKINLNITLKSIQTGIPLRVFDIMGCGGFVLSNYQQEFADYFEYDKDLVWYESQVDLLEKMKYYLKHDAQRKVIAQNGFDKVVKFHTIEQRVNRMLKVIKK